MAPKSILSKPPLFDAIDKNNVKLAKKLIAKNSTDLEVVYYSKTPLHHAIDFNEEIALLLIEKGVDIETEHEHCTPLHRAIWNRRKNIAFALIAKGADLEAKDYNDRPSLHCAIQAQQIEIALALINRNVNIEFSYLGYTPLHHAIAYSQKEVALALIEKGVDLNALFDGMTLLHHAIVHDQIDVILELIKRGASLNALYKGMTPLQHALTLGRKGITRALIEKSNNLDISLQEEGEMRTILHYSIWKGDAHLALALIKKPVNLEKLYKSRYLKQEFTPLHYAIYLKRTQIALDLILHNAKLRSSTIHLAIEREEIEIVRALVNRMDIDEVHNGMTPLHHAIFMGNVEIALLLIERGAKVDALYKGMTPLHHAISRHHEYVATDYVKIVHALLNKGAKLDIPYRGLTPLAHAKFKRKENVIKAIKHAMFQRPPAYLPTFERSERTEKAVVAVSTGKRKRNN